jgi:flagellar basal-body rod modification protein FlgD
MSTASTDPTASAGIGGNGAAAAAAAAAAAGNNTGLGKDDFLKILMSQMSNMDPLSADSQDPSQMVNQMTQYSILEQITNLNASALMDQVSTAHSQAISLIGHQVSYLPAGGSADAPPTPIQGTVKSVQVGDDGLPTVTIDDKSGISLGQVTAVQ